MSSFNLDLGFLESAGIKIEKNRVFESGERFGFKAGVCTGFHLMDRCWKTDTTFSKLTSAEKDQIRQTIVNRLKQLKITHLHRITELIFVEEDRAAYIGAGESLTSLPEYVITWSPRHQVMPLFSEKGSVYVVHTVQDSSVESLPTQAVVVTGAGSSGQEMAKQVMKALRDSATIPHLRNRLVKAEMKIRELTKHREGN